MSVSTLWRCDTHRNDTQQYKALWQSAYWHFYHLCTRCHFAENAYSEPQYVDCRYAKRHFAECGSACIPKHKA